VIDRHQVSQKVHAEQVGLLYLALPTSTISNILIPIVLVFVEWSIFEHSYLIVWFVMIVLVQLMRAALYISYRRMYERIDLARWSFLFLLGSTATALVWASNIIFIFPEKIEYQVFLAFVVAGMSAGAVTLLSPLRSPVMSFLAILLIPLAIRLFMQGGSIGIAMGIMVTIYLVLTLNTANRMFKNTKQNIEMKYEVLNMDAALTESENKYHHIFESVPLGIAYYNNEGMILDYNSGYRNLTGMSDNELRKWNLLKDGGDSDFHSKVAASLGKHVVQYEGLATVIGGDEKVNIRAFLTAIEFDREDLNEGVAIIQDITEDKQVEKAKQEFISTISHELRTPLTSIQAVLGLIDGGQVGEVSETMKPMIDTANRNSKRLAALINDILDMGKMESGGIPIYLVNAQVKPLLEEVLLVMQPYASQSDVTLEFLCEIDDVSINVDEKRFSQIMCNLLSNAAKFSPAGSVVVVGVVIVNDKVRIDVTDHGPGIPEEFHDKIFERFTQYDTSNTRSVGGSGLGLSISQRLVKQMNGEIGFTTGIDKGTTFFVEFPLVDE